jgi:hypothetical protein
LLLATLGGKTICGTCGKKRAEAICFCTHALGNCLWVLRRVAKSFTAAVLPQALPNRTLALDALAALAALAFAVGWLPAIALLGAMLKTKKTKKNKTIKQAVVRESKGLKTVMCTSVAKPCFMPAW